MNRIIRLLAAALLLYASCVTASAQTWWPSPGGGILNGAVVMCLNGSGQAVPCSAGTPLNIAGTFSATLSGFAPGLTYANLTATNASASVALPAGTVVGFQNTGTTTVSCTLGVGSATAAANEILVPPSSTVFVTVGSNTFGACIDQTGSASNLVALMGGSGLGSGFGGGGGSGGGGAITAAASSYSAGAFVAGTGVDGWDITQGTKSDAQCASGATTPCSVEARLAHMETLMALPLPPCSANPCPTTVGNTGSLGIAQNVEQTAASNGAQVQMATDLAHKLINLPYANPENFLNGEITAAMTGTTSTALTGMGAQGAGVRVYATACTFSNSHATVGTLIQLQDGSGGSVLWTVPAAAAFQGAVVVFPTPIKTTANNGLFAANVTTGSSTLVSCTGYKGV